MPKGRIRIKLKAYDSRVIDNCCQQIVETAIRTGAGVQGPVPLPTKRTVFCVNKGPFTDKDAREHFEMKIHKRMIDVIDPTEKTLDSLSHLDMPAGVDIEIKM